MRPPRYQTLLSCSVFQTQFIWLSFPLRYAAHTDHVTALAFSSDGSTLISVGGGDAIYLWDVAPPLLEAVDAMAKEAVEEALRQVRYLQPFCALCVDSFY
jgi:hypothetical protein